MALPPLLANLTLPVVGAPLFIISNPQLVIEQCQAGVVGSMPALNARPAAQLDEWLAEISETLAAWNRTHPDRPAAPSELMMIGTWYLAQASMSCSSRSLLRCTIWLIA